VINIVEDWPEGLRFWTAVVDSGGQFGHEGLLVRRQVVTITEFMGRWQHGRCSCRCPFKSCQILIILAPLES
jgi:hypothetical protein